MAEKINQNKEGIYVVKEDFERNTGNGKGNKKGPGRPVKFPDSDQERTLFSRLIDQGLSIRKMANQTGMSKDMVCIKLKRYGLNGRKRVKASIRKNIFLYDPKPVESVEKFI